jgi:hypothetical protein
MTEPPEFFVPGAKPTTQESLYAVFAKMLKKPVPKPRAQESLYAELAKLCKRPIPKPRERIYSITFIRGEVEWNATVGQILQGRRLESIPRRKKRLDDFIPLRDPAIVLAIFPGNPFMVVTNYHIWGNALSAWKNPFWVSLSEIRFKSFFFLPW